MIKELLFRKTQIPMLRRGLDALDLRQKAITNNIANAQSEGYKRQLVTFEQELQGALNRTGEGLYRTHPDHLSPERPGARVRPILRNADERLDGPGSEGVVVEREMADMAQNEIKYEAEAKLARQHFEMLRMAIRGQT